jgi:hypothetical protein
MPIHRVLILVAAFFSSTFVLGSWGWQEPVQAAQDEKGNVSGGSGDVTLGIAGDEGTRFSGVCSVGQEEHDISGRVPQSFEYEPKDRKLVCEVRRQGVQNAELKVVLKDENTRSVQRSEGGGDTMMRLVYENGNLSYSMSSSSSQKMSGTGSSSSSAANDDAQGVDDQESLADQIREKVDEILEQALP